MTGYLDTQLEARYEKPHKVRSEVSKQLEKAQRQAGPIAGSQSPGPDVPEDYRHLLEEYLDQLPACAIVSQVELTNQLSAPCQAGTDSRPEIADPGRRRRKMRALLELCDQRRCKQRTPDHLSSLRGSPGGGVI